MKFSKYFMLAGAAAMLAACSSEEPMPAPNGTPAEVANADTYALIGLQMPAEGTRAYTFVDGTPAEYAVANGQILIFKDADSGEEADATFVAAEGIRGVWESDAATDISRYTEMQVAFTKGTFEENATYSALIVLNYNDDFDLPLAGQTFGTWSKTNQQDNDWTLSEGGNTYTTMTSAPQWVTDHAETLVAIDTDKLATSTDNLTESAATFYVQRVVAKVSVKSAESDNEFTVSGGAYSGDAVKLLAWDLDNRAVSSYPVQVVDGLNLSASHMHGGTSFTRCFWGKTSLYDAPSASALEKISESDLTAGNFADKYVKENTFSIGNMNHGHTTRVVLQAQHTPKGIAQNTTFYRVGANTTLWTKADLESVILTKAKVLWPAATKVTINKTAAGYYTLADFCTILNTDDELMKDVLGEADANALKDKIAYELGLNDATTDKSIELYQNGKSYYKVLVRHFDDSEAPLNKKIETTGNYEASHLGRYGILRNNWYEVNITGINNLGTPTIPEIDPNIPDDGEGDEKDAILFDVRMLNWAKRTQNTPL